MKWFYPALLVLIVGQVRASDVQIFGADKPVPNYGYAELSVKLETGDQATWQVFPFPAQKTDNGDGKLIFAGKPGQKYQASVVVVNFDKKKLDTGGKELTFAPLPGPQPDPPDNPDNPDAVTTSLLGKLRTAAELEDPTELVLLPRLADVYRSGVTALGSDATMKTVSETMAAKAVQNGVAGHLQVFQRATSKYVKDNTLWKEADVGRTMTPAEIAKAKKVFTTLADTIDKVK